MKQVIGLDLGGTSLKGALVNERGLIRFREVVATEKMTRKEIVDALVAMIKTLESRASGKVLGVGLGMPGPLDPFSGTVLATPNLPFKKPFPIKNYLEKKCSVRVAVNNDANCAVLGEAWLGAAAGARYVVMLTLGTGIGGGLILDGKLYIGAHGLGAELGHITISDDAKTLGNFEKLASAAAVVTRARGLIDPNIDNAKQVEDLLRAGNKKAREIYEQEGRYLGRAVANYINIFNPEFVILGGGLAKGFSVFKKTMMQEVRRRAFLQLLKQAKIVPAKLGDDAGVLGAAKLVFDAQE